MANNRRKAVGSPPRRRISFTALFLSGAALLGSAVLTSFAASRQGQGFGVVPKAAEEARAQIEGQKRVRKIDYEPNKKLRDELRTDDDILEIENWRPAGTAPLPPNGQTPIEYLTKQVPLVAVLKVTGLEGQLSRNGDWVDTTVASELVQVLKTSVSSPLYNGSPFSFVSPGGEARVGKSVVRVKSQNDEFFEVGRTYLVFVRQLDGQWWATIEETASIGDVIVQPLAAGGAHNFKVRDKQAILAEINTYALVRD